MARQFVGAGVRLQVGDGSSQEGWVTGDGFPQWQLNLGQARHLPRPLAVTPLAVDAGLGQGTR